MDTSRLQETLKHKLKLTSDIETPHGSSVSIVRAEELTICVEPHVGRVVFGRGEDEVAVTVEANHGQRASMPLKKNRSLDEQE